MISISVVANTGRIDELSHDLFKQLSKAVAKGAFFFEKEAKRRAPVDTGTLRSSIYTSTFTLNGYAKALAEAKAKGNGKHTDLLMGPVPRNNFEAYVTVGVHYGIFVEYGFMSKRSNTKRVGHRAGKIGIKIDTGDSEFYSPGIYTYTPGWFYMHEAAIATRPVFRELVKKAMTHYKP